MSKKDQLWFWPLFAVVAFCLLIVWPRMMQATGFPQSQSSDTLNITLLSSTTSNKTGSAYFIEGATTHTIQVVTLCTNAVSNVISASLDNTNFFTIATNAVSASSTNAITFIGYRFGYIKASFTQTTANGSTNTILYLGGRQ